MIITRNKDVYAAALKFAQARLCPPSVEQMAALAAYNMPMDYFAGVRAEYDRRRNVLYDGLKDIPGSSSASPKAPSTSSSACRSRTSSISPSGSSRISRSTGRRS